MVASTTSESTSYLPLATSANLPDHDIELSKEWGRFSVRDVIGVTAGVGVVLLILLALIGRFWWRFRKDSALKMSKEKIPPNQKPQPYEPILMQEDDNLVNSHRAKLPADMERPNEIAYATAVCSTGGPRRLHSRDIGWIAEWTWDILLTLGPLFFLIISVLILRLENQSLSPSGQKVLDITRLGPSIYPILFAAVASRFYKNLARWRLEQPQGIDMASLEQIFGSQSFAGAFERLLLVRTQVPIGIVILVMWALSPLAGQGSSRMLYSGKSITKQNETLFYDHPSYQFPSTPDTNGKIENRGSIDSLYMSNLLSSEDQKHSPRDLWGLPRIPQWLKNNSAGRFYDINKESLSRGEAYYTSLLGIQLQGIGFASQGSTYNFTIQTSYLDFECRQVGSSLEINNYTRYIPNHELNVTRLFDMKDRTDFNSFGAYISTEGSAEERPKLQKTPPRKLLYASKKSETVDSYDNPLFALFNCTMEPVVLETQMQCGPNPPTSCSAQRQRRIANKHAAEYLLEKLPYSQDKMRQLLYIWTQASGSTEVGLASPTDNYLAGDPFPYGGQYWQNWDDITIADFSRRLTTAFNTFRFATVDPISRTNNSIGLVMDKGVTKEMMESYWTNFTQVEATTHYPIYKINRVWVGIVLATTFILETLAILGLLLKFLIHGPDILGFASSLTRENPYVPLANDDTGLSGPDRAKMLRYVRIRLADVCPDDEVGYVAVQAVPSEHHMESDGKTKATDLERRPFTSGRLYK